MGTFTFSPFERFAGQLSSCPNLLMRIFKKLLASKTFTSLINRMEETILLNTFEESLL